MSNTPIYDEVAELLGDPFRVAHYSIDDDSLWTTLPGAVWSVTDAHHLLQTLHAEPLSATFIRYIPSEETNMQMNGNPADQGPESFTTGENPIVPVQIPGEPTDRSRFMEKVHRDPKLSDHLRQGWRFERRDHDMDDLVAEDGRGIRIWWNSDGSFARASYFVDGKPCAMHHTSNDPYDALIDAVRGRDNWVYPVVQAADLFPPQPDHEDLGYGPSLDDNDPRIPVAEAPTPEGTEIASERVDFLLEHPEQATHDEIQRGMLAIQSFPYRSFSIGLKSPSALPDEGHIAVTLPGDGRMTGTVLDGLLGYVEREQQLHPEPVDDGKYVNPGAALAERQARESTEEARKVAPTFGVIVDGELHFEQNQGSPMGAFTKPQVSEQVAQKIADRVSSLKAHVDRIIGVSDSVTDDGELPNETTDSTTPEKSVLDEAAATISTGRVDDYGQAEDSFGVIASFWGTYLSARLGTPVTIDGRDVAQMMNLLKTARDTQSRKRDNLVDGAGYLALAERAVSSDR